MKQLTISLLCLLSLFVVGCGITSEAPPIPALPEPVSLATPDTQPVAYGASVEEWDEAMQTDTEDVLLVDGGVSSSDASSSDPVEASYEQIMWDALIPADFTSDSIMAKYADQIAALDHGSPEAYEIYAQMQEEFNNAPVNDEVDGTLVMLPGFIAPLEYEDMLITEFLLVPYFGACIHEPAPPVNQTVLVKTAAGEGIATEDSYAPIWIKGKITAEGASTDLAESGYYMQDAVIEPYTP